MKMQPPSGPEKTNPIKADFKTKQMLLMVLTHNLANILPVKELFYRTCHTVFQTLVDLKVHPAGRPRCPVSQVTWAASPPGGLFLYRYIDKKPVHCLRVQLKKAGYDSRYKVFNRPVIQRMKRSRDETSNT
jgi:hypothetical protein